MATKGKYVNEAAPYIAEYVSRMQFAKLGITQPLAELDCLSADALLTVAAEYAEAEADQTKKASRRRR